MHTKTEETPHKLNPPFFMLIGHMHIFLYLQANNGPGVYECGASAFAVGGAAGTGATTLPACDAS